MLSCSVSLYTRSYERFSAIPICEYYARDSSLVADIWHVKLCVVVVVVVVVVVLVVVVVVIRFLTTD